MSRIDCEQVLRDIQVYLDGEIAGDECADIERHLGECGPCLGRADFVRALRELLRAKCGCHDVPSDLETRVRSALRDDPAV